ncbi:hypothetical protein KUF54_10390 [Comamonas sp. Y33R10-2]|uniref:hypothetical protein n=1 Tax=Comamonas sp. Y33R10-2 TaxID=2853257 RepID=UPI001C5C8DB3|nr:hypothetical protein [Comamonas sp. Y33R10-2]QXZ08509.1 hypothetical protein KUF54_10390 [Comamonas sp. Y33R10-2]
MRYQKQKVSLLTNDSLRAVVRHLSGKIFSISAHMKTLAVKTGLWPLFLVRRTALTLACRHALAQTDGFKPASLSKIENYKQKRNQL